MLCDFCRRESDEFVNIKYADTDAGEINLCSDCEQLQVVIRTLADTWEE